MSTWTTIPDDVLEPGKPIRSVYAIVLRDNPIAIAAGAAGAPRVQTAAINDLAVTNAKIANASVTSNKLATGNDERDWVLNRTAGASVGAVGTYAFLQDITDSNTNVSAGSTVAGSSLRYAGPYFDSIQDKWIVFGSGTPAGTWRLLGWGQRVGGVAAQRYASLFLRIS